jgi:hypothetical protein
MSFPAINEVHASLLTPRLPVKYTIAAAWLTTWSRHPSLPSIGGWRYPQTPGTSYLGNSSHNFVPARLPYTSESTMDPRPKRCFTNLIAPSQHRRKSGNP